MERYNLVIAREGCYFSLNRPNTGSITLWTVFKEEEMTEQMKSASAPICDVMLQGDIGLRLQTKHFTWID